MDIPWAMIELERHVRDGLDFLAPASVGCAKRRRKTVRFSELSRVRHLKAVEVEVVARRQVVVELKNMTLGASSIELPRSNRDALNLRPIGAEVAERLCAEAVPVQARKAEHRVVIRADP